jgi:hypothetical protein
MATEAEKTYLRDARRLKLQAAIFVASSDIQMGAYLVAIKGIMADKGILCPGVSRGSRGTGKPLKGHGV